MVVLLYIKTSLADAVAAGCARSALLFADFAAPTHRRQQRGLTTMSRTTGCQTMIVVGNRLRVIVISDIRKVIWNNIDKLALFAVFVAGMPPASSGRTR